MKIEEYLVKERKVLKVNDDADKLSFYLQEQFANKMNQYLQEYEVERSEQTRTINSSSHTRHAG
jgi:hypothetical protein